MILAQLLAWIPAALKVQQLVTAADLILEIKVTMARTDVVFGTRKAVIANAATQILMRQAPQAIDLIAETFALTGGEARMLLAAGRGEALLLAGSHRVAFQTVASAREHQLCAD